MTDLLLWTDIETTGLNDTKGTLLEVGMRVTDWTGSNVAEPFNQVILPTFWSDLRKERTGYAWSLHNKNGLIEQIDELYKLEQANKDMPDWGHRKREVRRLVSEYINVANDMAGDWNLMLAGSSVHFDKRWLSQKFSPTLFDRMHHRIMDISSIRELARHMNPELYANEPKKTTDHRAQHCLDDSIRMFDYYRKAIMGIRSIHDDDK